MESAQKTLIVLDDAPGDIELLRRILSRMDGQATDLEAFLDWESARQALARRDGNALLVDFRMGTTTGIEVIENLRESGDQRPMILLTGVGDEDLAVEALQRGADDYLNKGRLDPESLRRSLARAYTQSGLRRAKAEAEAALRASEAQYRQMAEELAETNRQLTNFITEDALTGMSNRRHFDAILEAEVRRARRKGDIISLLFCDVDFFKQYNDLFGHPVGDACLKSIAEAFRAIFQRAGELAARYGGEEFTVILPGVPEADAIRVAEKLRREVESLAIPHVRPDGHPCVTLSLGLVSTRVNPGVDPAWLLSCADQALYTSKQNGRNRTTVYGLQGIHPSPKKEPGSTQEA